jgi:NaMN:DMB phosphoribosyltransferase
MTNFNRRTFMSVAGIAAAEPAMSVLLPGETRTSASAAAATGMANGPMKLWLAGNRSPRARVWRHAWRYRV